MELCNTPSGERRRFRCRCSVPLHTAEKHVSAGPGAFPARCAEERRDVCSGSETGACSRNRTLPRNRVHGNPRLESLPEPATGNPARRAEPTGQGTERTNGANRVPVRNSPKRIAIGKEDRLCKTVRRPARMDGRRFRRDRPPLKQRGRRTVQNRDRRNRCNRR